MESSILDDAIDKLVQEHQIHAEQLTRRQLAECIKQAILSGDFVKHVHSSGAVESQAIVYLPYHEAQQLRDRIRELEQIIYDNIEDGADLL